MSLTIWSLVIFATYALFYLSMFIAVTFKISVAKIAAMISFWIINQVAILWYGLATNQIGFVLMFIFQFIITFVTIIISTGRSMNENI